MEGEGNQAMVQNSTQESSTKEETSGVPTTIQNQELVSSFLQSKELMDRAVSESVYKLRDGMVADITNSVITEVNKRLEEHNRIAESQFQKRDEMEVGVERMVEGAKKLKMGY